MKIRIDRLNCSSRNPLPLSAAHTCDENQKPLRNRVRRRQAFLLSIEDTIAWHGVVALLIEFSPNGKVSLSADGDGIILDVGDRKCELTRAEAAALTDAIEDVLTRRREFLQTVGEFRDDGSYVVSRRRAESAGNRKVFRGFDELRRLYERLPERFTATDVGRSGITGSRRHMIVQHLCEHPAFECSIDQRNPLTGHKAAVAESD